MTSPGPEESVTAAQGGGRPEQAGDSTGEPEEFGMLFEKGNPLVRCVDEALAAMTADGTLDQLNQEWLSDVVDVPVLQ